MLGGSAAQAPVPQLAGSLPERPPTEGWASARGAGSVQVGQGWDASLSLIRPQAENSP